jgi:hypothetical protein
MELSNIDLLNDHKIDHDIVEYLRGNVIKDGDYGPDIFNDDEILDDIDRHLVENNEAADKSQLSPKAHRSDISGETTMLSDFNVVIDSTNIYVAQLHWVPAEIRINA